jgi:NAD(P)-dependent dehydrogenase (short-subunit alcohol dehydrogenase family)
MLGREVAKHMAARGGPGSIIHISSVGGTLGVAETFAYCASKAALGMLTKTMALSLAAYGIRVNAVAPGPTESPMLAPLPQAVRQRMLSRTPLGRFAEPDEVAAVALFLASDDASYLTGQTIYADGGRLALNYTVEPPAPSA